MAAAISFYSHGNSSNGRVRLRQAYLDVVWWVESHRACPTWCHSYNTAYPMAVVVELCKPKNGGTHLIISECDFLFQSTEDWDILESEGIEKNFILLKF